MTAPRRRRWVWWLAAAVLLLGAGGWLARTLAHRAAAGAAAAPRAAVAAPAIELAPTDLAVATETELAQTLAVSGSLKAVQSAFVKAKVAAELRELTVREGDRVGAGQLLGRLDSTEFQWRLRQAEDQARSAEAQLQITERTLVNHKAMVDQGFISKNALDTAVSNEAGARAALMAARAAAELARKAVADTEIRAPIAGLVSQRLANPGERVAVDAKIVEIVDLAHIELEAAVTPEDVTSVRVGQAARVWVEGMAEPIAARVARINPAAQSGTRTVLAYLEVQPHPALRHGLFARASIDVQRRRVLVVPASAVRQDQARPYVIALEAGAAVNKPVVLGARGEVSIDGRPETAQEVTQGLVAGAQVLRSSVGSLRAGTRLVVAGGAAPAPADAAASAAPRP